ncbi:Short chain dehydrogenase [Lachnellula willkommii]|uniref:Short chain dehydrogenase n=1 Tax=Lachnellula willkommii TaxID=215461 RepID=A0A559MA17_9HELO|nr:Short chain dehydrogenase [Lachnellula willkommii]
MAALPPHIGLNFTSTIHKDINPSTDPTKSDLSQPSKVVLITGAGRGIGRSIALQYAAANVATVIICARTASELDEVEQAIHGINSSVQVRKLPLDVSNDAAVAAAATKVRTEEGCLDVLVNNAGASDDWAPISEGDVKAYWNTWTVNFKGTYLMLHGFLPLLVDTAEAKQTLVDVVNIASIGAHVIIPGASAYQTSKFAVLRLTEFLLAEYGDKGVNCVAVHPGGFLTEMSARIEAIRPSLTDTPDLCAGFVVWFTKGQRSWLCGRYLSSAWDVDELEAKRDEIVQGEKLKMRMVV